MKGSKLYSIFTGKCPVCQSATMYKNNNAYVLSETLEMHDRCPHCDTKFKIEPSFFYGAMYVSYAVGVAVAFATFVIAHWGLGIGLLGSFIAIILIMVLTLPLMLRLSRNIWINFFFTFDKEKV